MKKVQFGRIKLMKIMKNTLNRLLFEESSKNFALIVSTYKLLQFLEIHLNKILSKMSLNSANLNEN